MIHLVNLVHPVILSKLVSRYRLQYWWFNRVSATKPHRNLFDDIKAHGNQKACDQRVSQHSGDHDRSQNLSRRRARSG